VKPLLLFLLTLTTASALQHFEARQRRPLDQTPDGQLLLALHSPASSLSVFAAGPSSTSAPVLIAEIPVGMEPVTVRARNNDEVWVVNEVSDSVSIVSLSRRTVIATVEVGDEPADLCFAAGKAFVSCARSREVVVIDPNSRAILARVPVPGLMPSALAASADGTRLYIASLLSGNRSTVLKASVAPAQPAPTNPALPAPPDTALIVPATDPRVNWNVLDRDIAEIDTASHTLLRWISGVGTHLFALALHPDGSLWCANSESLNLTRFEPELRGEFVRHRLSRIALPAANVTHHDLNPGIARATTPAPASVALALAQPTAVAFNSDGSRTWTAAYNSDRIAEIDSATGAVLRRVDLREPDAGTAAMRGPRSLVLSPDGARIFVLNKISDTLATVSVAAGTVMAESRLGSTDPLGPARRHGRAMLHDARLSGNGTISCATCHLDAEHDGLAWDLGDPGGEMVSIPSADLSIHDEDVYLRHLHPMKGPMVTQTLRGLALNDSALSIPAAAVTTKFHWRGDKPSIQSFNSTYPNLMGGTLQAEADMDRLADYLRDIVHHPNPNRNLDRSLKTSLNGGNASTGRELFISHAKSHCMICHGFNAGTDQNLDLPGEVGRTQGIKNPPLRLIYQKAGIFNPVAGQDSLSGFGMGADGTLSILPRAHPYNLDSLRNANLPDLTAFLLSFDTATAPMVGHEVVVTPTNTAAVAADLTLLETRAAAGDGGVVAGGILAGQRRSFRWHTGTQRYLADSAADAPRTRAQLLALVVGTGDTLVFSGVPLDRVAILGGDRDGDGIPDRDELPPAPELIRPGGVLTLRWTGGHDWYPETSTHLADGWSPWHGPVTGDGGMLSTEIPAPTDPLRFFRLSRTW
jgi:YVTN family beta-propeller protein